MRAPGFWWRRRRSFAALLLMPFSWLYSAIAAWRLSKPATRVPVPIICIGNFTAGGAGKTPTAIALCRILQAADETPFFLSRGYGGSETGPLPVDPARHSPGQVGDEPLLLARHAPTVISRDRIAGARLAHAMGASAVIMDDGMQNPHLAKDLTLAVVDGRTGIGNGLAIPAGPLRLAMAKQWPLADGVIVIGAGEAGQDVAAAANAAGKPVFNAALHPVSGALQHLAGCRVLAFAGIGQPEKFFATLRAAGITVAREVAFPDHHAFSADELSSLAALAEKEGLVPVTTEKDHVRITASGMTEQVKILPVELSFSSTDIENMLEAALARARSRQ